MRKGAKAQSGGVTAPVRHIMSYSSYSSYWSYLVVIYRG